MDTDAYEDARCAWQVEAAFAFFACFENGAVSAEWWYFGHVCLFLEEQFVDSKFRVCATATGVVAKEGAVLDCAGPELRRKICLKQQSDGCFSKSTDSVFGWAYAVVLINSADLMVNEMKFKEVLEFCGHELAALVCAQFAWVCTVDASNETAVCVDEVVFAFYKFHDASSRVAAYKGNEVVDVSDALCAHLS